MKVFILICLIGIPCMDAVMHSWKAFYTGSSGLSEFPEFVALNLLDDEVMGYFDSKTNRFEAKKSWMMGTLGQEYVERQTNILLGHSQTFKGNVGILKERFNQSGGVHIVQWMYGCEWDEEAGEVRAFYQYGYDGEDFLAMDVKHEEWIAPKPEAVITKHKWYRTNELSYQKNYLTTTCPEWLKKYVNYGSSVLRRTERPSVSLLQRTPSSPVSCHATGFYPSSAELLWRKDGEEVHEGVTKGEILPNNDGTFQMSADLDVSSVPAEDWTKYECVFQLSNTADLPTRLEKRIIKTNAGSNVAMVIGIIVAAAFLLVIAVIGFILYRKKDAKRPPSPVENAEVQEQMIPKA